MNEKKVMFLIFGLVVLVAIIGLILFCNSAKTGEFSVPIAVKIKPSSIIKKTPVKISPDRVIVSRKIKEDTKLTKVPETKAVDNCCLWMNQGMSFHISEAAAKYMGFSPSKIDSSEFFDKTDLVFVKKPYFYDESIKCVKGGTPENKMAGTVLCIQSYKGIELIPNAGLLCYDSRWWLAGEVCGDKNLAVPGSPAIPE